MILGWAGLRGAVPVVLATFPVIAHVPQSREFFNIVFFAVVLSTLAAGHDVRAAGASGWASRATSPRCRSRSPSRRRSARLGAEVIEYRVREDDAAVGARVRELGLPREALVST